MEDINLVPIPASIVHIGIDKEGGKFNDNWEYTTVVGILMYLAQTFRHDIAYTAHQCTRFTHAPRYSHVIGIKEPKK